MVVLLSLMAPVINSPPALLVRIAKRQQDSSVCPVDIDNITFVEIFSGLSCISKIFDSKYYDFGMTRDDKGTVSLYLNGQRCASGISTSASHVHLDSTCPC